MSQYTDNILFELKNVNFSYGNNSVVYSISLKIKKGESVILLGANGSGKSTLLKILSGLLFPNSGAVSAFGREISEKILSKDNFGIYFRAAVGVLFQHSDAQLFNPSVYEEIAFGPMQINQDKQKVDSEVQLVMDLLDINHLKDRSPFELSGGEKRKVAIASILVLSPEVLFLDEPTIELDPKSERLLLDVLLEYKKSGKTSVIATHNLHIAAELATRIIVIGDRCNVLADDVPEKILQNKELLKKANLIHHHKHRHCGLDGDVWHEHEHDHGFSHFHEH